MPPPSPFHTLPGYYSIYHYLHLMIHWQMQVTMSSNEFVFWVSSQDDICTGVLLRGWDA